MSEIRLKNNNIEKVRESNFELLRIIAMIMVITLHYMGHGGALGSTEFLSTNFFISNLFESFSIYAVDIYVLISAYFMCKSSINLKKILKIWMQVVSYTVGVYVLISILGIAKFELKTLIKMFTPIISNQYEFVTAYIILIIFSPYLNKLISSLSKVEFKRLIIKIVLIFVIFGSYFKISQITYSYLSTFIVLYFIGAYIRNYLKIDEKNRMKYLAIYIICSAMIFIGRLVMIYLGKNHFASLLLSYNNVLVILGALGLFMFMKSISIKSKFINNISLITFGVFLIHDNPYIRSILYTSILHTNRWYYSIWFIVVAIISIIGVFISCAIIEQVRIKIFDMLNIVDNVYNSIIFLVNKFKKNYTSIYNIQDIV